MLTSATKKMSLGNPEDHITLELFKMLAPKTPLKGLDGSTMGFKPAMDGPKGGYGVNNYSPIRDFQNQNTGKTEPYVLLEHSDGNHAFYYPLSELSV